MVWTAPMTAVSNAVFTADQWNENVRDNLNTTAPAIATTANRIIVGAGMNLIAERPILDDIIETAETTASTSYTDLATVGPQITIETGTRAFVVVNCQIANTNSGARNFVGFTVSGETTTAASDNTSLEWMTDAATQRTRNSVYNLVTVNPGINVFTMVYRVDAGTGTFRRRRLQVIGL